MKIACSISSSLAMIQREKWGPEGHNLKTKCIHFTIKHVGQQIIVVNTCLLQPLELFDLHCV